MKKTERQHVHCNASDLSRQIAERLGWSEEDELGLYHELSQVPTGFLKDAFLQLTNIVQRTQHEYTAYVKGSCVRDAQYSAVPYADHLDDDAWIDAPETGLFLGVFSADSAEHAKEAAAQYATVDDRRIDPDIIVVHQHCARTGNTQISGKD